MPLMAKSWRRSLMRGLLVQLPGNCERWRSIWGGLTDTRRELRVLLKETIEQQHGVRDPEFGVEAIGGIVPAEDIRGQTVMHDLRQFEADVREAARQIGKAVPPMRTFDTEATADNVFAWVYALRAGLLSPTGA